MRRRHTDWTGNWTSTHEKPAVKQAGHSIGWRSRAMRVRQPSPVRQAAKSCAMLCCDAEHRGSRHAGFQAGQHAALHAPRLHRQRRVRSQPFDKGTDAAHPCAIDGSATGVPADPLLGRSMVGHRTVLSNSSEDRLIGCFAWIRQAELRRYWQFPVSQGLSRIRHNGRMPSQPAR